MVFSLLVVVWWCLGLLGLGTHSMSVIDGELGLDVILIDERSCHEIVVGLNPSQEDMMVALNRSRSKKRGNGNCFFLSLAESVGRFFGFDNQI